MVHFYLLLDFLLFIYHVLYGLENYSLGHFEDLESFYRLHQAVNVLAETEKTHHRPTRVTVYHFRMQVAQLSPSEVQLHAFFVELAEYLKVYLGLVLENGNWEKKIL